MTLYFLTCIIFAMIIMNAIDRKPDVKKAYKEEKALFVIALILTSLFWPLSLITAVLIKIFR